MTLDTDTCASLLSYLHVFSGRLILPRVHSFAGASPSHSGSTAPFMKFRSARAGNRRFLL